MKLSIIIPCYNELNTISKILKLINQKVEYDKEIIVIDDFSNDGSRELLKSLDKNQIQKLILNEKNFGKGYSVRKGFEIASGDIVIIQDADLEYDPSEYQRLLKPIIENKADVVFGSRFMCHDERRVLYYWHTLGNKVLTLLSNMLSNLNLTDMEVCYKVFKKDVIKDIKLKENRFGFEPEITAKIAKKKFKTL